MGKTRKQRCSNHGNSEEPDRRRIKRDKAGEEQYQKEVKQGAKFLAGINPADPHAHNPADNPDDIQPNPNDIQPNPNMNYLDDLNPEFMPDLRPIINVQDPAPAEGDDIIERFVAQNRELRHARKREELRKFWEGIENQLTAAYLVSQANTSNWTSKLSFLNDRSDICHCAEGRFHYQNVDLIGVLSRQITNTATSDCNSY